MDRDCDRGGCRDRDGGPDYCALPDGVDYNPRRRYLFSENSPGPFIVGLVAIGAYELVSELEAGSPRLHQAIEKAQALIDVLFR